MTDQPRVVVINGPNLNMLGKREPGLYGSQTLEDIEAYCRTEGARLGLSVDCFQSNYEGRIVERIHATLGQEHGIVLNAGAYTHTSVALHDALRSVTAPVIEVHLSNIYQREAFRHKSFISSVAQGVLCGFGMQGYCFALQSLATMVQTPDDSH